MGIRQVGTEKQISNITPLYLLIYYPLSLQDGYKINIGVHKNRFNTDTIWWPQNLKFRNKKEAKNVQLCA